MTTLTRTQTATLIAARMRPDGAIILPARLKGAPATRFITTLIKAGLARMAKAGRSKSTANSDRPALLITAAGRKAVGDHPVAAPAAETQASAPTTKQARVLSMLARAEGASLGELTTATGWLPHTMRAALVRLRQKGHPIERHRDADEVSRYRMGEAAAA